MNERRGSVTPYLIAVLAIFFMVCASLLTLEIARPGGKWNSNTFHTIVGTGGVILTALLGIIKSAANAKAIEEVKSAVTPEVDSE